MAWLVDDRGVTWSKHAHPVAQWWASCDPIDYAVFERGFIEIKAMREGLTVSFNPRRTRQSTLIASFYVIAEARPRRIALTYRLSDKHQIEIFGSVGSAVRRMEELIESEPFETATMFSKERQHLDSGCDDIRTLLQIWSAEQGQWTLERYASLSAANLLDYTVVQKSRGMQYFVNWHWGSRVDMLGERWTRIAIGRGIDQQPFPALARKLVTLYRRTLKEQRPSLYDASLAVPGANGKSVLYRYERLLLPWSGGRNQYVMNAVSLKSQDVL